MSDDRQVLERPEVDAPSGPEVRDVETTTGADELLARVAGSTARSRTRDVLELVVESGGE